MNYLWYAPTFYSNPSIKECYLQITIIQPFYTICDPTGIRTPIESLEGFSPIRWTMRPIKILLWSITTIHFKVFPTWVGRPGLFPSISPHDSLQLRSIPRCVITGACFSPIFVVFFERVDGIEPTSSDWKSEIITVIRYSQLRWTSDLCTEMRPFN